MMGTHSVTASAAESSYPDLVPFDPPPGSEFRAVWPADEWLFEARSKVIAHPRADRRVALLPFEMAGVVLGGALWDVRGVGLLALSQDGSLQDMHRPGEEQARMARGPDGLACYLATWSGERPILIELWEMRIDSDDSEAWVHVWWRPNFTQPRKPKTALTGFEAFSRKQRAAFEKDLWDFLEGKAKPGGNTASESVKREWLAGIRETIDAIYDGNKAPDVTNWAVAIADRRGIGARTVHDRLAKCRTSITQEVEAGHTRWQRKIKRRTR